MTWSLALDWQARPLPPPSEFRAMLEAASARTVSLEYGKPRRVPWFERALYRALGLRVVEASPLGGLHVLFAGDLAFVRYALDDEDGLVATDAGKPLAPGGSVTFALPNGEASQEKLAHCLPRSVALSLLEQFYASGRRPSGVEWLDISKNNAA